MSKYYWQDGEEVLELDKDQFVSKFAKVHSPPPYEEDGSVMDPDQISQGLFAMAQTKNDLPDEIAHYSEFYESMKEALDASAELAKQATKDKEAAKEAAKAAKEEEKAAKEAAKQQIVAKRNAFSDAVAAATSGANDALRDELESVKDRLPTGIQVDAIEGGSFGLTIDKSVSDEELAGSLGYFLSQDRNNEFMKNAYQFFIGEIANEMMARGIYPSMIQCAKDLSVKMNDDLGIRLHPRAFENYARMAHRIPVEYRNPRADPSAYLAISDMPYPKKPREGDYTTKQLFKDALAEWETAKERVDNSRLKMAAMLRDGYILVEEDGEEIKQEMLSRKDILPIIDEVKINLGLKERPDPGKKSAGDYLRQYFDADNALELFGGIHAAGQVRAANEGGTIDFDAESLAALKEEAKNALITLLYPKMEQLKEGEEVKSRQVYEEKDGKKVAKRDEDGALVKEEYIQKIYVKFPWVG